MQPLPSLKHPCGHDPMVEMPAIAATLALRRAQRAFADVLEDEGRGAVHGPLPRARRAAAARRTLSALSADDAARLQRWLALQLAASGTVDAAERLARVDAELATGIGALLAGTRDELAGRRRTGAAAA